MSYRYVTFYALTDRQRSVARFCFWFGLGALVLCGVGLIFSSAVIAQPAGVDPSTWVWTPADGYSLGCSVHWPSFAFYPPDTLVAVNAHHQEVAEGARLLEAMNMPRVKDVEATIGEHEVLAKPPTVIEFG